MNPKSLTQQRFGRYAQGYVASSDHASGADLDRLVEIAHPQPGWIVLDIATGGGHTALRFSPRVRRVVASDLTLEMLQSARVFIARQGVVNMIFSAADAEALPFRDMAFDLATCRIAPHHFTDCARFVSEASRVLKPGGQLLVQDHVLPDDVEAAGYVEAFEKLRDPSHQRACSEEEWNGMFLEAGLQVEHAERIVKQHQFKSWVERQGCPLEVVERLAAMLQAAPPAAAAWMQPRDAGTPEATFSNQHIIIAGRKKTSSRRGARSASLLTVRTSHATG